MQQNITVIHNVLSLINSLIFYQGMNHLVKVTGGIGTFHPIFCVPVGGNPDLVKLLIIYSLSQVCVSVTLREFLDNFPCQLSTIKIVEREKLQDFFIDK